MQCKWEFPVLWHGDTRRIICINVKDTYERHVASCGHSHLEVGDVYYSMVGFYVVDAAFFVKTGRYAGSFPVVAVRDEVDIVRLKMAGYTVRDE